MNLDAAQQHIILLKLKELYDNPDTPLNQTSHSVMGVSPSIKWLVSVGVLLKRYDRYGLGRKFDNLRQTFSSNQTVLCQHVLVLMEEAIQNIRLDLELDRRNEIGTAYGPGERYRYFSDLKKIIGGATEEVFVVDPYFNGEAFDNYLGEDSGNVAIRLLVERYVKEVTNYAAKHIEDFGTGIAIRKSNDLHDRLVIVDRADCWISGGSIKDGGQKPTYLIPFAPGLAEKKLQIYEEIWTRSKPIDLP